MSFFKRLFGRGKKDVSMNEDAHLKTSKDIEIYKHESSHEKTKVGYMDTFISEVENRDMLWISFDKNIPDNYNVVSFKVNLNNKGEIETETVIHKKTDPSTIWVHLPISKPTKDDNLSLPYFPHYIDLTPAQRFEYLNWLRDIDISIDMGYVFLYFYGLERHLLIGDIERAIKIIIRLRNEHLNKSFQTYSRNSIIHACIMRNRVDLLLDIHKHTNIQDFSNAQILLAHNFGLDVSASNLIDLYFYQCYHK